MPNGRHNIGCGFCSNSNGPRKDVRCGLFGKAIPSLWDDSASFLCSEFQANSAYLANLDNYPDQRAAILQNIEADKAQIPFGKLCRVSNYDGISIVMDLNDTPFG